MTFDDKVVLNEENNENNENEFDVISEWYFVLEKIGTNPILVSTVVSQVQAEYTGRGPAFEVPTAKTIIQGINELTAAGLVKLAS